MFLKFYSAAIISNTAEVNLLVDCGNKNKTVLLRIAIIAKKGNTDSFKVGPKSTNVNIHL